MTNTQTNDSIAKAFLNLSELNQQVYDYWISELYTVDGNLIEHAWNEATLKQMEDDVMFNS